MNFVWSDEIRAAECAAKALAEQAKAAALGVEEMKAAHIVAVLAARGIAIGDRVDVVRLDRKWGSETQYEVRETGIFTGLHRGSYRTEPEIKKIKKDGTASTVKVFLSYGAEIVPEGAPFPQPPEVTE